MAYLRSTLGALLTAVAAGCADAPSPIDTGGDTTSPSPGTTDALPDPTTGDDPSTSASGETTTGDATDTGSSEDSTGEPEPPPLDPRDLDFVVTVTDPGEPARLVRYTIVDGELAGPMPANDALPGTAEVGPLFPIAGTHRLVYLTEGGLDDLVLADFSSTDAVEFDQLDVGIGNHADIHRIGVEWVPGASALVYESETRAYAVHIDDDGPAPPEIVFEEDEERWYLMPDPETGLAVIGVGEIGEAVLWLTDLAAPDPDGIALAGPADGQVVGLPAFLEAGAGLAYRTETAKPEERSAFVSEFDGVSASMQHHVSTVSAPELLTSITAPAGSGGLVLSWDADGANFGRSELYWISLDGAQPEAPVALHNDAMGEVYWMRPSPGGRFGAYEGALVADGSPLHPFVVELGDVPGPAREVMDVEIDWLRFVHDDRWLYYKVTGGGLWRTDVTTDPFEHQLVGADFFNISSVSRDGTTLCIDEDVDGQEAFLLFDATAETIGDPDVILVDVPAGRDARACQISPGGRYLLFNEALNLVDRGLVLIDLEHPESPLLRIDAEFVGRARAMPFLY